MNYRVDRLENFDDDIYTMDNLPIDIISMISSGINIEEFLKLCATNKTYSNICSKNQVWGLFLKRDFNIDYYAKNIGISPRDYYIFMYNNPANRIKRYTSNPTIPNLFRLINIVKQIFKQYGGQSFLSRSNTDKKLLGRIWSTILNEMSPENLNLLEKNYNEIINKLVDVFRTIDWSKQPFNMLDHSCFNRHYYACFSYYAVAIIYLGSDFYQRFISDPYTELTNYYRFYTRQSLSPTGQLLVQFISANDILGRTLLKLSRE